MNNKIIIKGAKENNLKDVNIEIPKDKLVIITGVSGSGKSSLAFDTIYEEGKRRYMESLSSYARMFLGGNEKPNVDSIDGLSPSISIDQKTTSHNPRSTVGTVTEIYDYLRVLYARIGVPYCPNGHGKITNQTVKQIQDKILDSCKTGDKLQILAPVVNREKGTFKNELEKLKREGFLRVRVDGQILSLDESIELEKSKVHSIAIVIDRIVFNKDKETTSRVNEALEIALKYGDGKVITLINEKEEFYTKTHACPICGFSIPELEPRLFSFNSPTGACDYCKGLGFTYEPDEEKMIPDPELSINEGGIDWFKKSVNTLSIDWQKADAIIKHYKINKDNPIKDLTKKEIKYILYGSDEEINYTIKTTGGITNRKTEYIEGVLEMIKRRHLETSSEMAREYYSKYMTEKECKVCHGQRLNEAALSVKINNKNIIDVTDMSISVAIDFFLQLKLNAQEEEIGKAAIKEIVDRLSFLNNVGLGYLTLSRSASTLSGGEAQRIRLATQIGSKLSGILYVLDEPSIGLHQRDNTKLVTALKAMRDLGNSLIVVEHDLETIEESDWVVDVGPGAGVYGGNIIAEGTPLAIAKNKNSLTGKYLSGELNIPVPETRRSGNGQKIVVKGAKLNNLKNVDVTIPLGKFVCITGVSGSGKSTLINDVVAKNLQKNLFSPFTSAPKITSISGFLNVDKLIMVSQEPIGRSPRSNPATYAGVFDDIRDLYASLPESKARGYTKSRFSFNVPGGRCEKCQGDGVQTIQMHFLPNVYVKCDECNGKKYNDETLSIKFKNKSVFDVLEMSVDEALEFFQNIPSIRLKLETMRDVGLGYIQLGLGADKLSGGEAQRIKLAKFLQKRTSANSILILDEPTTGLHLHDIQKLIDVLNRIVDSGATVIVIEHNLDLIKCADHIIDLGPEGGEDGGLIIATGTPEQILAKKDVSWTAKYLEKYLKKIN